jgi:nucleoid-associated protein YgaU
MNSVTTASKMRRTMLGMAGAAAVAMVMALPATPAMAQPLNEQPIQPIQPLNEQPLFDQSLVEQPMFNADFEHVVQPGETLSGIAADAGTTHDVLAAENGIANPQLIHPGQVVRHSR